ncbi:RNA polymerase factor sigma-54 [Virgibacillus salarius]|uniref:RNA polymerase factor sigma-54 n=1 Tax=Virgibacillus salarius TaxID=447199 RepID=UPI0024926DDE|nr:RNA polymerase factor sigma-54 [Virgibacillus salarius]WBX78705.1 RNA polymerase factor sigma-54 [Virgibacillus salarius]
MKLQLVNEQVLQWKMNQSLMQSIQVLQMSSMELMEYIREIEKENPVIEEIRYNDEHVQYRSSDTSVSIGEINSSELTLYDQLKQQLFTLSISEEIRPVVLFGIDSLNESGYLDVSLDIWAAKCNTTIEIVEEALKHIQSLEPAGIGARSLSECIELQLAAQSFVPAFLQDLIQEHIEWLADDNIQRISEHYGVSHSYVEEVIDHIKNCHPKLGQLLTTKKADYIIPEATIFKEAGNWKISFYSWSVPKITINTDYQNSTFKEKQTANYVKEKLNQLESLKKAIVYRSDTLERVIQVIVEKQHMYFEKGASMLRPLTLREIASDLDLHVSTISRTVANKYVQTTNGVLPLNFFLQSGIKQANGSKASALAVKQMIAELISNEDKINPLSDEKIKNKLALDYNLQIARRTVMKYREQLNIPASLKRKER